MIVVTHSKELAEEADVILTLKQGTVIATEDVGCNNEIAETGVSVKLNFAAPNIQNDDTTNNT